MKDEIRRILANLLNISHLRCGRVRVRFMRLRRIYQTRNDGRHKCRPYNDLKRKFLYYQVIKKREEVAHFLRV